MTTIVLAIIIFAIIFSVSNYINSVPNKPIFKKEEKKGPQTLEEKELFIKRALANVDYLRSKIRSDASQKLINEFKLSFPIDNVDEQLFNKGVEEFDKKDFFYAEAFFWLAISINPSSAKYYFYRGKTREELPDVEGALNDFSKAIELEPNNNVYWYSRGNLYKNLLKDDLALSDYNKAAELGCLNSKEIIIGLTKSSEDVSTSKGPQYIIRGRRTRFDPNDLRDFLEVQYGIKYLYHITHKENLGNILKYGLLSNDESRQGLNIVDIADNEVNSRRSAIEPINNSSLHEYVPLYFNPRNPMLYKRIDIQHDIIIIALDSYLFFNRGRIFTDGNAAANKTLFYDDIRDLNQLDWKCINSEFWSEFPDGKRIRCAEVLIPNKVNITSIEKIYVCDEKILDYVNSFALSQYGISAEVDLSFYF